MDDAFAEQGIRMLMPSTLCHAYGVIFGSPSVCVGCIALGNMHQRGELGLRSSPNVFSPLGALALVCYHARQLVRRRKCRPENIAIGLISAFMALMNLESIVSQRAAPHRPLYLCPALDLWGKNLPSANWAGVMAVGWLLHLWLPKLFLPTSWPASWHHACAQLSVALSWTACCLCVADMISDRPQVEHFCAAGLGIYPTLVCGMSLLAAVTFEWLATRDGTGCRVVAPYLAMLTVYRASLVYRHATHVSWDGRPIGAVGAGLAAMVLAILASEAPDRVCSASPMFMYTPSVVKALRCSSLAGVRQWLKETLPSWRASHVVYCLNAMLSVLIYGPLWSRMYAQFTMESERSMWRTTMVDVRTRRMMTVAMSCLAIMVGLASLFADRWRERVNWEGVSCFRFVPTDRHFRTLVVLKCGVLATKIDLLLVRSGAEAHQPMLLVLQLISIATTAGVASWNTIKLHATALDLIGEFNDTFRSPASLLRATRLATVAWYCWTAVLLSIVATSDGLGHSYIRAVRDTLGFYVWVNMFWLIASNELTLLISSKVSRPQVFEAVQSPTGLRAVLAYIFVFAPWSVYCTVCHAGWSGHGGFLWLPISLSAWTACLGWFAYSSLGEHARTLVETSSSRPPQDTLPAPVAQV